MTSAYSMLIPPFQSLVDRLLVQTEGEGWEVRRAYLASVYEVLDRGRKDNPAVNPEEALSGIIAAVIERVGEPPVESRLQAGIYAASAAAHHRVASAEWFDGHPGEYDQISRELAGGGPRLN